MHTPMHKDEPATAQLLPFSRHGGQQLALLCVLTDHSGTSGRCPVPEVAGGVQECLFWTGQHHRPDWAGLVSTAEEPDHHGLCCMLLWAWRSCCLFLAGPPVTAKIAQGSEGGHLAVTAALQLPEEIHCACPAPRTSGVL